MISTGTIVNGYEIVGVLGGHAETAGVYEARSTADGRGVALKLYATHLSRDRAFVERFLSELGILADLHHPRIARLEDAGESERGLFLALQLIRGESLQDLIRAGLMSGERTLELLEPVAEALDEAHAMGLVHRDLKPTSILLDSTRDGEPVITGFDLGHALAGDLRYGLHGTSEYRSPEQLAGQQPTARSDVYSLAGILYDCMTSGQAGGVEPSEGARRLNEPPLALRKVLRRGLAQDPAERHASAGELIRDAARALGPDPGTPEPRAEEAGTVDAPETAASAPAARAAGRARTPSAGLGTASRSRLGLGLAAVLAVLVAVGVAMAAGGDGERSEANRGAEGATTVRRDGISLTYPSLWRPLERAPRVPGLELESPLALEPLGGDGEAGLVAGQVAQPGPGLLPDSLRERLEGESPPRESVRLGRLEAFRYRGARLSGSDKRFNIYAVEHSGGAATVVCFADEAEADAVLPGCERIAASMQLPGSRTYGVSPNAAYAERVNGAMGTLNEARARARADFTRARTPDGQARVADRLARSYGTAAATLDREQVTPQIRSANGAIVAALTATRDAYRQTGAAARRGDRPAYDAARAEVRRSEAAVERSLRRLRDVGYAVS